MSVAFPSLRRDQKDQLFARSLGRFHALPAEPVQFDQLNTGAVYAFTLRYKNGYVPPNMQQGDIMAAMSGGYAQDYVRVTLAQIIRKIPRVEQDDQQMDQDSEDESLDEEDSQDSQYEDSQDEDSQDEDDQFDEVEVELETQVCLSHGCGPTDLSNRYVLHRDGEVKYFRANGAIVSWSTSKPRWEFTRFPVLPVVVLGMD